MLEIITLLALVPFSLHIISKSKRDLHMMQLNSYRIDRYCKWVSKNFKGYLTFLSFIPFIALIAAYFLNLAVSIAFWGLSYCLLLLSQVKYEAKLPLKFTSRAKRLFSAILFFYVVIALTAAIANVGNGVIAIQILLVLMTILGLFSFIPAVGGLLITSPLEKAIQNWYYNDARKILAHFPNLTIIGITGSFGKTSTKFALNDVLSYYFNTLMTPSSFNTKMGVTKVVRNDLKSIHQYFIVEMGAKQPGDIREICDLVHPKIGILTAIGEQHLETFRSLETICKTKSELIESLPSDGLAVLNGDDPNIRALRFKNSPRKIYFGVESADLNYSVHDIVVNQEGTSFSVQTSKGESATFYTKLLGKHNLYNLVAAISVACELGIDLQQLPNQIKKIKPAPHRLEIKKVSGDITIIDNAFSSNPIGAKMALEVLGQMTGTRKILVTPGMVELGTKQYEYNKDFGICAAKVCDFIVLVGVQQTLPIQDGLQTANYSNANLYVASDLNDASKYLRTITRPGDVILYENDLPDNF